MVMVVMAVVAVVVVVVAAAAATAVRVMVVVAVVRVHSRLEPTTTTAKPTHYDSRNNNNTHPPLPLLVLLAGGFEGLALQLLDLFLRQLRTLVGLLFAAPRVFGFFLLGRTLPRLSGVFAYLLGLADWTVDESASRRTDTL